MALMETVMRILLLCSAGAVHAALIWQVLQVWKPKKPHTRAERIIIRFAPLPLGMIPAAVLFMPFVDWLFSVDPFSLGTDLAVGALAGVGAAAVAQASHSWFRVALPELWSIAKEALRARTGGDDGR